MDTFVVGAVYGFGVGVIVVFLIWSMSIVRLRQYLQEQEDKRFERREAQELEEIMDQTDFSIEGYEEWLNEQSRADG